jgi:hypothetical protein
MPSWKEHVKATYSKMKAEATQNSTKVTLRSAMAEAKKTYTPVKVQMAPKEEAAAESVGAGGGAVDSTRAGDTRVLEAARNPFILRFNN